MTTQAYVLMVLAACLMLCYLGALTGAALYRIYALPVLGDRIILVSLIGFAASAVLIVIVGSYTAATLGKSH